MTIQDVVEFYDRVKPRKWIFRGILIAFAIVLAILTHWPHVRLIPIPGIRWSDKVYHFCAYGILTSLIVLSVQDSRHVACRLLRGLGLQSVAIWLCVLGLGFVDELTQPWVGRSFELRDLLADVSGAALALLLFNLGALSGYVRRFLRGRVAHGPQRHVGSDPRAAFRRDR